MATSIDISALNTALGAYYRTNNREITTKLYLGNEWREWVTVRTGIKDQKPLPRLKTGNMLQHGDRKNFTPKTNNISLDARILKTRHIKVDEEIDPYELQETYEGFLYELEQSGQNQRQMPPTLAGYIFDAMISQVREEFRLNCVFKGVYNAGATTPISMANGFLKELEDAITATEVTPVVTGALTAADILDQIKEVYDALAPAYKAVVTVCPLPTEAYAWVSDKLNPVYNTNLGGNSNQGLLDSSATSMTMRMPGRPNLILANEPGMGTSQRIMITQKSNLIYGCDLESDMNNFLSEVNHRLIDYMMDFKAGFQFRQVDEGALACNDQA